MMSLAGWTPIRIYWQGRQPMVDWCYTDDARFADPFFDQTIERVLRKPFQLLFRHQTPLEVLGELGEAEPEVRPTGFIFHMSRCGSTLVSQMLAALPQNIVISEASPIDSVLRANWRDRHITDEERITWLRGLVSAFGRRTSGREEHLYIKFDSWHTLCLDLVRRAFPDVPWIFIYRDPVPVMASHRRMAGAQMIPGNLDPGFLGIEIAALADMSLDEYCVRVLERICSAALAHHDRAARFYNYRQLPAIVWSDLLDHFHVAYRAAELERMREVTRFDAKNPTLPFADDTAAKNRAATPGMRDLAERRLLPLYKQLESVRQAERAPAGVLAPAAAER